MAKKSKEIDMPDRKRRMTKDVIAFSVIGYILIAIFALACLLPFILVITSSFATESWIKEHGYSLIPGEFSLAGYAILAKYPKDMLNAYKVTIYVTAVGTFLGLIITSLTAFVLSRKDFEWRNKFSFFFFFTTLFSGGVVPWYILCVQYLHFKEVPAIALFMPFLISVFNLIIMKSFMSSIPDEICEAAKIDGTSNFRVYWQIILPLSKPALATIGLFVALGYWNDWYLSYMFANSPDAYTLQFYLYKTLNAQKALQDLATKSGVSIGNVPTETMKMAMVVIATGPILLLYPFVQKYFVQGLTIGAVKG